MRRVLVVLGMVLALVGSTVAGGALPAGRADAASELVAARTAVFGATNVDQATGAVRADRVLFSWFGVANFAVAMGGQVFLVDAWVPNVYPRHVPTTPAQLAALKPSHIFIGHAHFDHAADAVDIARASGARLVGSAEHCGFFRGQDAALRCDVVSAAGARPASTTTYRGLPGIEVTALRHLHSQIKAPTGALPPLLPLPPSDKLLTDPPGPAELARLAPHLNDPEGGSMAYKFTVGGTSVLWHDSVGPVSHDPAGPAILAALRRLGPVDLHVGAIQGFNEIANGLHDAMAYIDAVGATVFVPSHHDDWFPVLATPATGREAAFFAALKTIDHSPQVRYLRDPADYLNPDRVSIPVNRP
ncbi:hypothetical protein GOHSU_06_00470 [Gordonia hirsuta DSM 44140 = NBRC 16056]|uniref:Metallo-beta-lactamase domain-containing protein n=1 Tax=Gordonia hirsuta DSM 44140 = NBRC 16056 TaxID=1121927 RepID=L7L5M0_9ACTN|nr:MBL fold metallo-hydrolase [Gordonia hirsuta]GAC56435.1 hypothetical protein GOHSU_06_00470 [Gordonia hirsuta DSM 44140 = NBRC 16056]